MLAGSSTLHQNVDWTTPIQNTGFCHQTGQKQKKLPCLEGERRECSNLGYSSGGDSSGGHPCQLCHFMSKCCPTFLDPPVSVFQEAVAITFNFLSSVSRKRRKNRIHNKIPHLVGEEDTCQTYICYLWQSRHQQKCNTR